MTRAAKKANRCAESVTDQVSGQCVARALVDPVTLAESFDLNDGPAHHPTIHVKICPPKMTSEIMPYIYERPVGGEAAEGGDCGQLPAESSAWLFNDFLQLCVHENATREWNSCSKRHKIMICRLGLGGDALPRIRLPRRDSCFPSAVGDSSVIPARSYRYPLLLRLPDTQQTENGDETGADCTARAARLCVPLL
jgi:hypothetical protein